MKNRESQRLKSILQETYDIPFEVSGGITYDDYWFVITPKSQDEELFEIKVKIKNRLRLVVEVKPEKYAAFSIRDMSCASGEKKRIFAGYSKQLEERKAKILFQVNHTVCNSSDPESWPEDWKSYQLRISKSPVTGEDDPFDVVEITSVWLVIVAGMFLSLLNVTDNDDSGVYTEGGVRRIETNRYERNPVNRELCLAANGYSCSICGFDFQKEYGELGHHFIHVHHINPVSHSNDSYEINPVTDLIPVCPNCHAMLHRKNPPLQPEELADIISKIKN